VAEVIVMRRQRADDKYTRTRVSFPRLVIVRDVTMKHLFHEGLRRAMPGEHEAPIVCPLPHGWHGTLVATFLPTILPIGTSIHRCGYLKIVGVVTYGIRSIG